jgi:hypothetical protein
MGDLQSYGTGNYKFSAYVKFAAPTASGSCSPFLVIKYNDGSDHYATASGTAINADNYTQLRGTVNLSWIGTLNTAQLYVQTGNSGTTGWSAQLATLTVDTSNAHSGGPALKITNRSKDYSTVVQNVTGALQSYGASNYKLNAYVKLTASLASGSCNPFLVIKYNDGSDHYATTSGSAINANNYTQLQGTVTLSWNGELKSAQMYVQTGNSGTTCLADLYVDDFSLVNTDRSSPLPPQTGRLLDSSCYQLSY